MKVCFPQASYKGRGVGGAHPRRVPPHGSMIFGAQGEENRRGRRTYHTPGDPYGVGGLTAQNFKTVVLAEPWMYTMNYHRCVSNFAPLAKL